MENMMYQQDQNNRLRPNLCKNKVMLSFGLNSSDLRPEFETKLWTKIEVNLNNSVMNRWS